MCGDLYEPVMLHNLYANANPVKYKDPGGNMGSLQELNTTMAIYMPSRTRTEYILADLDIFHRMFWFYC